jgi:hypothetical protein
VIRFPLNPLRIPLRIARAKRQDPVRLLTQNCEFVGGQNGWCGEKTIARILLNINFGHGLHCRFSSLGTLEPDELCDALPHASQDQCLDDLPLEDQEDDQHRHHGH